MSGRGLPPTVSPVAGLSGSGAEIQIVGARSWIRSDNDTPEQSVLTPSRISCRAGQISNAASTLCPGVKTGVLGTAKWMQSSLK